MEKRRKTTGYEPSLRRGHGSVPCAPCLETWHLPCTIGNWQPKTDLTDSSVYRGVTCSRRPSEKICTVLVFMLIGMTSITLLACQWHEAPFGNEHTTPFTHHHGSSAHATRGAFCLIAVLPTMIGLAVSLTAWLADSPSRWQSALVVLLPFIPPRAASR